MPALGVGVSSPQGSQTAEQDEDLQQAIARSLARTFGEDLLQQQEDLLQKMAIAMSLREPPNSESAESRTSSTESIVQNHVEASSTENIVQNHVEDIALLHSESGVVDFDPVSCEISASEDVSSSRSPSATAFPAAVTPAGNVLWPPAANEFVAPFGVQDYDISVEAETDEQTTGVLSAESVASAVAEIDISGLESCTSKAGRQLRELQSDATREFLIDILQSIISDVEEWIKIVSKSTAAESGFVQLRVESQASSTKIPLTSDQISTVHKEYVYLADSFQSALKRFTSGTRNVEVDNKLKGLVAQVDDLFQQIGVSTGHKLTAAMGVPEKDATNKNQEGTNTKDGSSSWIWFVSIGAGSVVLALIAALVYHYCFKTVVVEEKKPQQQALMSQSTLMSRDTIPIVERVRICDEEEKQKYLANLSAIAVANEQKYFSFEGQARSILPHPNAPKEEPAPIKTQPKIDFRTAIPSRVVGTAMPGAPIEIKMPKPPTKFNAKVTPDEESKSISGSQPSQPTASSSTGPATSSTSTKPSLQRLKKKINSLTIKSEE